MATLIFLISLIIIATLYYFLRRKYIADFKSRRKVRKREQRLKELINSAFKIERLELIEERQSDVKLKYNKRAIAVNPDHIIKVDNTEDERIEIKYELPNEITKEEVFDFIIENSNFYITNERYNKLNTKQA
ncbi:hypothetical protein [Mammaliicoccus sp. Dog046]|uniref:hypothetical protein n=1 Tax=Mammaliicoccus sp. Dog046 TaxID=3034233 RepID=UPI002B261D48|nr:hypothetical protein [Mammaliicoccus sp. Dog046]WQK85777.1 hypothetical protein P3U32_01715 [Mammaliicoccus sp. Dog046]